MATRLQAAQAALHDTIFPQLLLAAQIMADAEGAFDSLTFP